MSYFQIKNLDYVLKKIVGGGTPSKAKEEYWNGDIPWLSVKDMKDDAYRLETTQDTITMSGVQNSSTNIIPKGTIIVSTRMGLGRCLINSVDMAINQDLKALIIDEKIVYRDYLFYVLKFKSEEILAMGSGTTVKGIRLDDLKSIEINLPPLKTQQKIASLLSNYDRLIENNTQRITLLESMAEELYKEWFVRLRFPGYEDVEVLDGVPEGWERKALIDIARLVMGQSPKSDAYNQDKNGLPFHQGVTNYGFRFPSNKTWSIEGKRYGEKGDILFSVRAPVGRLNIASEKIIIGRGISSIRHKKEWNSFLLYALKDIFFEDDLMGNGSIFSSVTKKDMENILIVEAETSIMDKLNSVIEPIDNEIEVLLHKNQTLKQTRDLLLPRLMSGKLNVEDLDII